MDLRLDGKKAIVSGGSAGMGKAIARQLAREGCDVAIGARTEARVRQAADEIARETGRTIVPLPLDTLDAVSIENFVKNAAESLGAIHILANCAARVGGTIPDTMETISDEQIVKDFEEKFLGYYRCARAAAPHMKQAGWRGHQHARAQHFLRGAHQVSRQHARSLRHQRQRDLSGHDSDRSGSGAEPQRGRETRKISRSGSRRVARPQPAALFGDGGGCGAGGDVSLLAAGDQHHRRGHRCRRRCECRCALLA